MVFEWSTDTAPAGERFAQWREACERHIYALSIERDANAPFSGRIAHRQMKGLDVIDIDCDAHEVHRRSQDISRQPGGSFYVYEQRGGSAWFEQAGRSEVARAGDIVIADPNVPFATGTDSRFDIRIWRIERARLGPMLALPSGELPMVKLAGGGDGERALISGWLDTLLRSYRDLPANSLELAVGTLCSLVANAAGATAEMREQAPIARRRALLQRVMRQVELRAANIELDAGAVAAEFSISLRSLHQLFEMSDTTFHAFLTQARVARASGMLRDPACGLSTTEIGFAAGFGEVSTFYRRFRQQHGVAPGEYRAGS